MSLNYAKLLSPEKPIEIEEESEPREKFISPPRIPVGKEMSLESWVNKYDNDIRNIRNTYCGTILEMYPDLIDLFLTKDFEKMFSKFLYENSSGKYII